MGFLRRLFTGDQLVPSAIDVVAGPQFDGLNIDSGVLYGVPPWQTTPPRKIPRATAMTVPAVKSARDLIANAIGTLPLKLHRPDGTEEPWALFEQPEAGVAPSITWTRVAEDLLFEGIAWLRITHVGWHGKPVQAIRLDPTSVTVQPDWKVYYSRTGNGTALEYLPDEHLIRIDSPNDPLLIAGARAIRTCIALGDSTDQAAGALPPLSYFRPADGSTDPADDDEIEEILTAWEVARAKRRTAYVPESLVLEKLGWNPEELQLTGLRDQAVLEIARLARVDAEELAVSTTSRTYFNAFDRKQNFIEFTLKGYLSAIEGRLSMDDVTPRGFKARHDLDGFFSADTLSRYKAYEVGKRVGAITGDEIREAEGRPPLTPAEQAIERALPDASERAPKEIAS